MVLRVCENLSSDFEKTIGYLNNLLLISCTFVW